MFGAGKVTYAALAVSFCWVCPQEICHSIITFSHLIQLDAIDLLQVFHDHRPGTYIATHLPANLFTDDDIAKDHSDADASKDVDSESTCSIATIQTQLSLPVAQPGLDTKWSNIHFNWNLCDMIYIYAKHKQIDF